jgi:hypothetical protein
LTDITKFSAVADLGVPALEQKNARQLILGFEAVLSQVPGAAFGDCFPLRHIFAPGVYCREITLPKDAVLVGKIHRERHLNFISRGRVKVFTEHGGLEELTGPMTMVSEPGTKRTVHVLEETVWTTIHHNPDDLTDLEELEELVIAPSFAAYDGQALENPKVLEHS